MRTLIIDNGTSYIDGLVSFLRKYIGMVEVISIFDFDYASKDDYQMILLSGGNHYSVAFDIEYYAKELELIRRSNKALIGICLGFELIARAFGADLELMQEKVYGNIKITLNPEYSIFNGLKDLTVYESHRWVVKNLSKNLYALGWSNDGIEIIKHKVLPIYGFQFHPEMVINNDGEKIFSRVFKALV